MRVTDMATTPDDRTEITVQFDDNGLLQVLFGPANANLDRIEERLGVSLSAMGNTVVIHGGATEAGEAEAVLDTLYRRARQGHDITLGEVDAVIRMEGEQVTGEAGGEDLTIRTRKRHVIPRSKTQADYVRVMRANELVFGMGPAGTGKTYMAVAQAVSMKIAGKVDRLILSRPAVEAGERLGFLPGDMREKIDPYLRPLYDALYDMMPGDQVVKELEAGTIEVAPLAFMRGRTLSNAFIILDEAQNTTPTQMKMFLTRLGENSRMVITGDLSQVDLPLGAKSGLRDALEVLDGQRGIGFITFSRKDVVRHDLVTRIVTAYDHRDRSGGALPHNHPGSTSR
ncbi:PhoH family protein [Caenispirillum bisanense]